MEAEADRDFVTLSNGKFSLAKNLALDYMVKELQGIEDPYALSIIVYVLQLSNHPFRENAFNILEGFAKVSGTAVFPVLIRCYALIFRIIVKLLLLEFDRRY